MTAASWLAGLKMMALAIMVVALELTAGAQTVVQSKSGFATGSTNPAVAFPSNNTAGNLLWVAVGSDATITTPTDTQGNTYTLAVSVTGSGGSGNAAIYYVTSAKAGANTVTCNHSGSGDTHCHIAEISGLVSSSPLDVTGSVASSATCSVSTSAATTQASEWIAAFFYDSPNSRTLTAGTNYTQIQLSNNTSAGDAAISESRNVSSTGTQTATCGGNSSDVLSQLITTFKAQSNSSGPSISSLSPTSGPVGTSVTISGSNFGSSQGSSTVTFNGTAATPTSWSGTSIVAPVPSGATTGNVVVTVGGTASNGVSFTVTSSAPSISSLSPTSGPVGTSVTISGSNFGSSQGSSTVTFNGTAATPTSWSGTSIAAPVPSGATTGKVVVTVGGTASNGVNFTVTSSAPTISSLSPTSGPVGTSVTITGTNFGSSQGSSTVTFNGTAATPTSWSNTSIAAPVPNGATTGNVVVTVGGTASNGVGFTVGNGGSAPNVVQSKSGFATGSTNPAVAFPSNNTSGNLLWVAVGSDATITTPTDTQGNTYTLAVSVTGSGGSGNAAIYYVTSAKAGANTVTCNHSGNGDTHCHIAEISGLVTSSPLDVTGSVASSATCSVSTSAATTQASEWIAAFFYDSPNSRTLTAGTNYTQIQLSNNTSAGDAAISESQNVGSTGTQTATCGGNSSDVLSQLITTFKAQNNSSGPSISGLTPGSGAVGSSIVIEGTNFGSTQGNGGVTFNGTTASIGSWSNTAIRAVVPTGATTGNVVVTVAGGVASSGVSFTVTGPPNIGSLTPSSGAVGSSIVIAGTNFGVTQDNGSVTFNGTAATATSWSNTSITATVPTGATTGNVVVTAAGGVASNGVSFTVVGAPSISSLTPNSGAVGSSIVIAGSNFGSTQGNGSVTFDGPVATISSWSNTSVTAVVPTEASTGNVVLTAAGGVASSGVSFTVVPAPSISSLSPNSGSAGTSVIIAGNNFGASQGNGGVSFNGKGATISSWSNTSVTAVAPTGVSTGNVVVTAAGGVSSNGVSFTVTNAPVISSLSPTSGPAGTSVTISGSNFGSSQGSSTVTFNGTAATPSSWSSTQIVAPVPANASTGNVVVTVGGITSNGVSFTVTGPPTLNSLSPTSGSVGTPVTITGNNFGSTQGSSLVMFSDESIAATPTSWSNTQIAVTVPPFASTGNVNVTVNGTASNGISFTVSSGISASPTSGAVGTSVTISGSNFGATQGSSTVTFGLVTAAPTSWSNTQIVAPVPNGVATGSQVLAVTVSGSTASTSFNILPAITSLSPTTSAVGSSVTINGTSFGSSSGTNTFVTFSNQNVAATPTTWSPTQIVVTVPTGATTGNVNVTANGAVSNGVNFTVSQTQTPSITSLLPANGAVGSSVVISGSDFGSTQGSVTFNGTAATISSWNSTSVTAVAPQGTTTGPVVVTAGGVASNGVTFTVTGAPNISSISPSGAFVGAQVTINGSNFHTPPAVGTVSFSGTSASVITWTDTYIVVNVPAGASSGNVVVTDDGGVASNGVNFTIQTPYSYTVGYAPNGDILSSNDNLNGNWTYTYDDFDRLSTAASSAHGFSYSYDQYGNRWQQNVTGGTGGSSNLTFTGSSTAGTNGNCYHAAGVVNQPDGYCFDAAGNLLSDGQHNYTYDAENRLIQVDGGNTATYTYGALGQRVEGPNGDYIYDLGGKMITQIGLNNVWNYGEIYAGRHIATYSGGTTSFFGSNWLGTKRAMVGLNLTLSQTCTGFPFGDGVNCTGTNINFNLFTDDVHDPETNLEHTLFRKYTSAMGRWLTPDPSGASAASSGNPQSWNMYAYVLNNPVNAVDPAGLDGSGFGGGGDGGGGCDPLDCGGGNPCGIFCGGGGGGLGIGAPIDLPPPPTCLGNTCIPYGSPLPVPPLGGAGGLGILPGESMGLPPGLALPGPLEAMLADLPWNKPCNSPWISDGCGFNSFQNGQQQAPTTPSNGFSNLIRLLWCGAGLATTGMLMDCDLTLHPITPQNLHTHARNQALMDPAANVALNPCVQHELTTATAVITAVATAPLAALSRYVTLVKAGTAVTAAELGSVGVEAGAVGLAAGLLGAVGACAWAGQLPTQPTPLN